MITCDPGPRTAVNQAPHGGVAYPFTVRQEIGCIVLDFYLSYEDLDCGLQLPFTLDWVYGLGTNVVAQPGGTPTPTHDVDLVIKDESGTVVFDSTTAGTFTLVEWGNRRVAEWKSDTQVARLVYRYDNRDDFDTHEVPQAELEPRTLNRLPKRVTALKVDVQSFQENVVFQNGFNTVFSTPAVVNKDGGRFISRLMLDVVPGSGAGRSPACDGVESVIKTIARVKPLPGGRFILQADECYRLQLPIGIQSQDGERVAAYTGDAQNALVVMDDCVPCCTCADFVDVYRGLKAQLDKWKRTASQLEDIRNLYAENRDRWLAARACRLAHPLRLVAITEPSCKTMIGVQFCNLTKCCLSPVELRITVQRYVDGTYVPSAPTSFSANDVFIEGSFTKHPDRYVMAGVWPVFRATLPFLQPQASGSVRLRLCYACSPKESLRVSATAHTPDPPVSPETGEICELTIADVPSETQSIWSDAGIVDDVSPVGHAFAVVPVNSSAAVNSCAC